MKSESLEGHKIAIIVESKFIPEEIHAYCFGFAAVGASVEYLSRIYYDDYKPGNPNWREPILLSDVDPNDDDPWVSPQKLKFTLNEGEQSTNKPILRDISTVNVNDYSAIIMTANYTSVRLRYNNFDFDNIPPDFNVQTFIREFPVPKFFAQAMTNKKIIKGALCHGLWILTPYPELLEGRKVIGHIVLWSDLALTKGKLIFKEVVVDKDLVTGFSKNEVVSFLKAIIKQILQLC